MPLARAVYRLSLLALPRAMRESDAEEMTDLFLRRVARARTGRERLGICLRALVDVGIAAVASRRHHARHLVPLEGDPMSTTPGSAWRAIAQDTRFAVRLLLRDRSFTATALLTLAICIAANTVVFTVVHAVVLRPLPVAHADRLVAFNNAYPNAGVPKASNGVPDYFDRLTQMPAIEALAVVRRQGATMAIADGSTRLRALRMSPSFIDVVSARAALGRLFAAADGEVGQNFKVVLSHALWQREFGGSPAAVGTSVRIGGQPHEIIGVLPAGFALIWNDIDVWLPAAFTPEDRADSARHSNNWTMIGRLAPGATLDQARQQVLAINARNDERFPEYRDILKDAGFTTIVNTMQDELVGDVRTALYLLWGGVLLVLAIGCVNIANLVLVRSTQRLREMATRHAVGAGLWRLRMQLVTESLILTVSGGVAGLALGWWAMSAASALGVDQLPRGFEVQFGATTVVVVLALSLVVGLVLGLMPVARASKLDVNRTLREEGRSGTAGRRTMLVRRTLATVQVALAFVLLLAAGLLLASFRAVLKIDPGFNPEGVLTAAVSLPAASYRDNTARLQFAERFLERVRRVPGVQAAGLTDLLPMSGDSNDSVVIPEGYVRKEGDSLISPLQSRVSDEYFSTMGIPLIAGRFFDARDRAGATRAVIVDERLAAKFWPDRDPIGRRLYQPSSPSEANAPGPNTIYATVVGVVKEVQIAGLATSYKPVGAYYYSMRQQPMSGFTVAVRSDGDPALLTPAVRAALREIDSELPLFADSTMAAYIDEALAGRRVPMLLSAVFGGVAVFLAAIGIYGVLAYGVAEKRREIGIRMALGSTTSAVFRLVIADGLKIVLLGLALGVVGAYYAGRGLQTLLYGVGAGDPVVVAGVAVLLAAIAFLATALPARRATKVNPVKALNS
ncbi:MAG TPA: ABC transporter permease [Vicinamibacterales bacterium]|nr:ABC transporter permease [Vicinamibacterales bacterium]